MLSTDGTRTNGNPDDTTIWIVPPGANSLWAGGSVRTTCPIGTVRLRSSVVLACQPNLETMFMASSTGRLLRSGTSSTAGPVDTNRITLAPGVISNPGSGDWSITSPSGTTGCS